MEQITAGAKVTLYTVILVSKSKITMTVYIQCVTYIYSQVSV